MVPKGPNSFQDVSRTAGASTNPRFTGGHGLQRGGGEERAGSHQWHLDRIQGLWLDKTTHLRDSFLDLVLGCVFVLEGTPRLRFFFFFFNRGSKRKTA